MAASGGARPWLDKAGRVSRRYRASRRRVCRYRYRCLAVPADAICSHCCGGVLLEEGIDGEAPRKFCQLQRRTRRQLNFLGANANCFNNLTLLLGTVLILTDKATLVNQAHQVCNPRPQFWQTQ